MNKKILISALLCAASVPVVAQSTQTDPLLPTLETMVVVSSREPMPMREVATSVAVLDEQQIKARGFTSLADVLRSLPSVTVSNNGGLGKASSLRVRGEEGFRTRVRVDGVDISDPTGTQASAPIQHLLSSNIGKVELLRGPQGMMYGADAGGVLNITTRRPALGHEFNVSAEGGSFNTRRYNANASGAGEVGDYYLSAAHVQSGGFNSSLNDTELQDDDGYRNTTLHGRAGWNITDKLRLQVVARNTDARNEFDRCGYPYIDDCMGDFEQTNARVSLAYATGQFNNTLVFSRTDIERDNYAAGENSYHTKGDIKKLEWNGSATLSEANKIVYGLLQRTDTVLGKSRDQWGVYAEYQGQFNRQFFITAGVRHDDNEDFGTHNSYRVSAAYLLDSLASGTLKFKTSYGTGFRAPSLYEIDYNRSQNNATLAPLDTENSKGVDAGIEYYANSGLHLETVVFDQRIDDEISFDLVGYTGYIQYAGQSRSRGVELSLDAPLAETLVLNANYTYINADASDNSPRARQPDNTANVGLTYTPIAALQISANLRAASGGVSTANKPLDDYQVLDASVRYHVTPKIALYIRGTNLTDENYIEVSDYRTAGASGYAGVDVSF